MNDTEAAGVTPALNSKTVTNDPQMVENYTQMVMNGADTETITTTEETSTDQGTETEFMPSVRRCSRGSPAGSVGAFPFFVALFIGALALFDRICGEAEVPVRSPGLTGTKPARRSIRRSERADAPGWLAGKLVGLLILAILALAFLFWLRNASHGLLP